MCNGLLHDNDCSWHDDDITCNCGALEFSKISEQLAATEADYHRELELRENNDCTIARLREELAASEQARKEAEFGEEVLRDALEWVKSPPGGISLEDMMNHAKSTLYALPAKVKKELNQEARAEEAERQLEVMREAMENIVTMRGVYPPDHSRHLLLKMCENVAKESLHSLPARSAKLRELVDAAAYYDSVLELDSSGRPVDDYDRDEAALSLRAKYRAYKEQP